MDHLIIYILLFSIIVLLGQVFHSSSIPTTFILLIGGMLLSVIPYFPTITLDSHLVLNFLLPLIVYEISAFSSWRDVKSQIRPIALLSIGHVLFITVLIAVVIHYLIPAIGWPLAFVLGAIISPPDNVAITAIAEKIRIPERVFIILEGESMFNDAAALTLFRLALVAAMTNHFSILHAFTEFSLIIIGEIIFGLLLGHLLGLIRTKITNTSLHLVASFLTPFFAYIPVVTLGGTGILATATVGFLIGNHYNLRFTPEYRLSALTIWPALGFTIQSLLFLLVGLNMQSTVIRILSIPFSSLMIYVLAIISTVIIGRFIWVYVFVLTLPRLISPALRKNDPFPPWQYPFITAWSGIRGSISLAAALAVPALTLKIDGVDVRDLLVFLVFCIIIVTFLLQGLSLPYILKLIGIDKINRAERYTEHLTELQARLQMTQAALSFLEEYKKKVNDNKKLLLEISMLVNEYKMLKNKMEFKIIDHHKKPDLIHKETHSDVSIILFQVVAAERDELAKLWREEKINLRTRNKLSAMLDHQVQRHLT